jgi:hypothetical protein
MPSAGLVPAISAGDLLQTHAVDRSATGIGRNAWLILQNSSQTILTLVVNSHAEFSHWSTIKQICCLIFWLRNVKLCRLLHGIRHTRHNITQMFEWFSMNFPWDCFLKIVLVSSFDASDTFPKANIYKANTQSYAVLIVYFEFREMCGFLTSRSACNSSVGAFCKKDL